jgi:hypothetical protein
MNSSNKLTHELTNNVETILMALEAIEVKLLAKDVKGAMTTLNLIKKRKSEALNTITKIKNELEKIES